MAKNERAGGGASWMRGAKRSLAWVTFDDDEKALVRQAAAASGVPMSQFLKEIGLKEAENILRKAAKTRKSS
jgi:uncharacterized protein (DUF1778 family)